MTERHTALTIQSAVAEAYKEYVCSFIRIRDERIREHVHRELLDSNRLWPQPIVQLNPPYEMGRPLDELARAEQMHDNVPRFFTDRSGQPIHLYLHQDEAICKVLAGRSVVVTSGTGSGKTLTYFVPIFNHIWQREPGGVCAIVVYPTNALVNSQLNWLREACSRAAEHGLPGLDPDRYFRRYTGQESDEEKADIQKHPPYILLTNYMMLELMLLRPKEHMLIGKALRFVVVDELHTYRGRTGADMALLMRRIRARSGRDDLIYIGTSATVASGDTPTDRRRATAEFASLLFGVDITPSDVVEESLRPWVDGSDEAVGGQELRRAVRQLAGSATGLAEAGPATNVLLRWFQDAIALEQDRLDDGSVRYRRRKPQSIDEAARALADETGVDADAARRVVERLLDWIGVQQSGLEPSRDVPAVKLHQFFCQGSPVYATLEPPDQRTLTFESAYYAAAKTGEQPRLLYPLAFCRHCGQEYYRVEYDRETGQLTPDQEPFLRRVVERRDDDAWSTKERGYIAVGVDWSDESVVDRLPDEWVSPSGRVVSTHADRIPRTVWVTPSGKCYDSPEDSRDAVQAVYQPAPFALCVSCGEAYTKQPSEYAKLTTLSAEGRSTTASLVALHAIWAMRAQGLADQAKVLIFADNRQDAALQAGHFNDLVARLRLRCAINRAVQRQGHIAYRDLPEAIVRELSLQPADFARSAELRPGTRAYQRAEETLRDVIRYRVLEDLHREGRVILPTLEECGLVRIKYLGLTEAAADAAWQNLTTLGALTAQQREELFEVLFDELRLRLAVDDPILIDPGRRNRLQTDAAQHLNETWGFERPDALASAAVAVFSSETGHRRTQQTVRLTAHGPLVRWMARQCAKQLDRPVTARELADELPTAFAILAAHGLVRLADRNTAGYRLAADCLLWERGDGTPFVRRARVIRAKGPTYADQIREANRLFQQLYHRDPQDYRGLRAAEHTAQISSELRQEREKLFREGALPVLCCSPTMELGIDIAELSVVMHRNVPPTPANYAQRAGRAGRAGQPAVVFTYCSQGSPHDQYFFARRNEMVGGIVRKPQIELANEDLIRAHLHAIWLGRTGVDLGRPIVELINMDDEQALPLAEAIQEQLRQVARDPEKRGECLAEITKVFRSVLERLPHARSRLASLERELDGRIIDEAAGKLDRAFDWWRNAYRSLLELHDETTRVARTGSVRGTRFQSLDEARQIQRAVENQLSLLRGEPDTRSLADEQSIFYPYRYLAGQMFLPGYGFPMRPVLAYLEQAHGEDGRYLSRQPLLAIGEFAPLNILYYDGRQFQMRYLQQLWHGRTVTEQLRICPHCGFVYFFSSDQRRDVCDYCHSELTGTDRTCYLDRAVRLVSVRASYRERVTCAEEERRRAGYEVQKYLTWGQGRTAADHEKVAIVGGNGQTLGSLCYMPSARVVAVNRGWRQSGGQGFLLDAATGRWLSQSDLDKDQRSKESDQRPRDILSGVVPFVEETSNALLLELDDIRELADRPPEGMLRPEEHGLAFAVSLAHALLRGILAEYQVEDSEVSVEPRSARYVAFYETAPGGVGVLKELVDDPEAIRRIARAALAVLHFNTEDATDSKGDDCPAACYECLLTYYNQPQHRLLNRHVVRRALLELATHAQLQRIPDPEDRYRRLLAQIDRRSELERRLLEHLYEYGYRLPDEAQYTIRLPGGEQVSVDFFYRGRLGETACVFCDGPPHDQPQIIERDRRLRGLLEEFGYRVVVIRYDRDLDQQVRQHPDVFGTATRRAAVSDPGNP